MIFNKLSLFNQIKYKPITNKQHANNDDIAKEEKKEEPRLNSQRLAKPDAVKIDYETLITQRKININYGLRTKLPIQEENGTDIEIDTNKAKAEAETKAKVKEETPKGTISPSIVQNSSLSEEYNKASVRKCSNITSKSKGLQLAEACALKDLNILANAIKAELQNSQPNYNEKLAQENIDEAISKTIDTFKNGFTTSKIKPNSDKKAFVFNGKGIFKRRGSCSYNVKALADTFMQEYNTICEKKQAMSIATKELKVNLYEELPAEFIEANFDEAIEIAIIKATTQEEVKLILNEELNSNIEEKLMQTSDLYFERFENAFDNKADFDILFNKAIEGALNSSDTQKSYNAADASFALNDKLMENINEYLWNLPDEPPESAQSSDINQSAFGVEVIRNAATRTTRAATRNGGVTQKGNTYKIDSDKVQVEISGIKIKNGYITTSPEKFPATGTITFKDVDGNERSVVLKLDIDLFSYIRKDVDYSNGINHESRLEAVLKDLQATFDRMNPQVLTDLANLGGSIDIKQPFLRPGETTPRSGANGASEGITLYYGVIKGFEEHLTEPTFNVSGIRVDVLTHEIGHSFANWNKTGELYHQIHNLLPEDLKHNYSMLTPGELGAEYYTYINNGTCSYTQVFEYIKSQNSNSEISKAFNEYCKVFERALEADRIANTGGSTKNIETQEELIDRMLEKSELDFTADDSRALRALIGANILKVDIIEKLISDYYDYSYKNEPNPIFDQLNSLPASDPLQSSWEKIKNYLEKSTQEYDEKYGDKGLVQNPETEPDYEDLLDESNNSDYDDDQNYGDSTLEPEPTPEPDPEPTPEPDPEPTPADPEDQTNYDGDNKAELPNDIEEQNNYELPDNALVDENGNAYIQNEDNLGRLSPSDDFGHVENIRDTLTPEEQLEKLNDLHEKYGDDYDIKVNEYGDALLTPKTDNTDDNTNTNGNESENSTDKSNDVNNNTNNANNNTSNNGSNDDDNNIDIDDYRNDDGSYDTNDFIDDAVNAGWDHWEYDDDEEISDVWDDIQDAYGSGDWDSFWEEMYS